MHFKDLIFFLDFRYIRPKCKKCYTFFFFFNEGFPNCVLFFIWRFLGGWDGLKAYNNILEYNQETEEWQEVGAMKEARFDHSVTVVSYEDYAEWCIWKLENIAFWSWCFIAPLFWYFKKIVKLKALCPILKGRAYHKTFNPI